MIRSRQFFFVKSCVSIKVFQFHPMLLSEFLIFKNKYPAYHRIFSNHLPHPVRILINRNPLASTHLSADEAAVPTNTPDLYPFNGGGIFFRMNSRRYSVGRLKRHSNSRDFGSFTQGNIGYIGNCFRVLYHFFFLSASTLEKISTAVRYPKYLRVT